MRSRNLPNASLLSSSTIFASPGPTDSTSSPVSSIAAGFQVVTLRSGDSSTIATGADTISAFSSAFSRFSCSFATFRSSVRRRTRLSRSRLSSSMLFSARLISVIFTYTATLPPLRVRYDERRNIRPSERPHSRMLVGVCASSSRSLINASVRPAAASSEPLTARLCNRVS